MRYIKIFVLLSLLPTLLMCNGDCTYKVISKIPNQKNSYKVVKFFNWCGYTSSNNINFSLLKNTDSLENRNRIIFVAASRVGDQLDKDTTVNISWLNDSTISILYDSSIQIFQKKSSLENFKIRYSLK
jgi:hypothetical protein